MLKALKRESLHHHHHTHVLLVDVPYGKFPTYGFSLRSISSYFGFYSLVTGLIELCGVLIIQYLLMDPTSADGFTFLGSLSGLDLSSDGLEEDVSPFISTRVKSDRVRGEMVQRILDGCLITRNRSIFGAESVIPTDIPNHARFVENIHTYTILRDLFLFLWIATSATCFTGGFIVYFGCRLGKHGNVMYILVVLIAKTVSIVVLSFCVLLMQFEMFCTWDHFLSSFKLTRLFTVVGILRILQNVYEVLLLRCYYLMICEEDRKVESLENPLKRTRLPPRKVLKIGDEILTPYPWVLTEQTFTAAQASRPGFNVAKSGYQHKIVPKPIPYESIEVTHIDKLPTKTDAPAGKFSVFMPTGIGRKSTHMEGSKKLSDVRIRAKSSIRPSEGRLGSSFALNRAYSNSSFTSQTTVSGERNKSFKFSIRNNNDGEHELESHIPSKERNQSKQGKNSIQFRDRNNSKK